MGHPVIHFESLADDLEKIENFYTGLFGWKMKTDANMPEYVMVETKTDGDGINGGIMKKHMPAQHPVNYVMVESVSEYAWAAKWWRPRPPSRKWATLPSASTPKATPSASSKWTKARPDEVGAHGMRPCRSNSVTQPPWRVHKPCPSCAQSARNQAP